ncbi:MAG: ComF family protein [Phycisphaerales bacterium]|nr:ComF family protein [Phycisphaerales bacterium]
MNWSAAWLSAGECIEREWIGVSRPHPARLLDGDPREGRPPFVPDAIGVAYCPRCGGSTGPGEFIEGKGCAACRKRRFPWERLVRLGRHHGDLRDWVHEIKFHAWDAMGLELGKRLGRCLKDAGVQADAVVPVPASAWRRWRRGIDHSRIIAAGAASVLDLPLARAMKRKGRKPQRAVSPSQRRENIRGAFSVRRLNFLRNCSIVLVDDVTTTRATLTEACRTLERQAGVGSITCAVLTVAEPGRDGPAAPPTDLF